MLLLWKIDKGRNFYKFESVSTSNVSCMFNLYVGNNFLHLFFLVHVSFDLDPSSLTIENKINS